MAPGRPFTHRVPGGLARCLPRADAAGGFAGRGLKPLFPRRGAWIHFWAGMRKRDGIKRPVRRFKGGRGRSRRYPLLTTTYTRFIYCPAPASMARRSAIACSLSAASRSDQQPPHSGLWSAARISSSASAQERLISCGRTSSSRHVPMPEQRQRLAAEKAFDRAKIMAAFHADHRVKIAVGKRQVVKVGMEGNDASPAALRRKARIILLALIHGSAANTSAPYSLCSMREVSAPCRGPSQARAPGASVASSISSSGILSAFGPKIPRPGSDWSKRFVPG